MARTVRVRAVRAVGGKIHLQFDNKQGLEFTDAAAVRAWANSWDDQEVALLMKLLVLWWLKTTGGTDPSLLTNAAATLDLAAVNKLVIG